MSDEDYYDFLCENQNQNIYDEDFWNKDIHWGHDIIYNKPIRHFGECSDDVLKLINDIFLCNYWDKKIKNAKLIDVNQILMWTDYFKDKTFNDISHLKIDCYGPKFNDISRNLKTIGGSIERNYPLVYELLKLSNGRISLCGGSIVNLIFQGYNGADWDLFFHCDSVEEADELLNDCMDYIQQNVKSKITYSRSQGVQTVNYNRKNIQFIRRIYKSKDQVLLGFDLAGSRLGYNIKDGLFATIDGAMALAMKSFAIDVTRRSLSFRYRIEKYLRKQFTILLPGLPEVLENEVVTPDGTLYINNGSKMHFGTDYMKEPDYDGTWYMNYYMINNEKYHNVTFGSQNLDEINDLPDNFIIKSFIDLKSFYGADRSKYNLEYRRGFLGDKLDDFEKMINVDEEKAFQIWEERGQWYIEKGLECAKLCKEHPWKYKNPGEQSFGTFSPIIGNPREWYGENYLSVEIGLKMDRFQAWMDCIKNIEYMNIPKDIFRIICNYWLKAEVDMARDRLFSYH